MDISALIGALLDTTINFFLKLVLDGLFGLLGDLFFGGTTGLV